MVFKNNTMYAMNIWDGCPITINIDHLTLGRYNFTLSVRHVW